MSTRVTLEWDPPFVAWVIYSHFLLYLYTNSYHIDSKEIGHGHYGVVRKCMHRESGEWYAIKSIRKAKVSKIEVLKREIDILKEVRHPNIILLVRKISLLIVNAGVEWWNFCQGRTYTCYGQLQVEVYEDERYLHLITELCTGGELFDRIIAKTQSAEGHFSEHDAAQLVHDILDAIRYCHSKGIVHRDLKPWVYLCMFHAMAGIGRQALFVLSKLKLGSMFFSLVAKISCSLHRTKNHPSKLLTLVFHGTMMWSME